MYHPSSSKKPSKYQTKEQITDAVIRLLANRDHSKHELINKLQSRCEHLESLEQVIAECEEKGYQSDTRFAQMIIRTRIEQWYGLERVEQELDAKGIEAEVSQLALEEAECDWYSVASECFIRKYQRSYNADDPKSYAKTVRAMAGRGFTMEQVFHAIPGANETEI